MGCATCRNMQHNDVAVAACTSTCDVPLMHVCCMFAPLPQICLSCIHSAGSAPDGFAAIKLTALGQPELLEHLSMILTETSRVYRVFVEQTLKPVEGVWGDGCACDEHDSTACCCHSNAHLPCCISIDSSQAAHLVGKITYDIFAKGMLSCML